MKYNNINIMKNGFTLVELLVVVAILGILAAVGIVSFSGFLGSAKEQSFNSQHDMIVKYIQNQFFICLLGNRDYMITLSKEGKEIQTQCDAPLYPNERVAMDAYSIFINHFSFENGHYGLLEESDYSGDEECRNTPSGNMPRKGLTDICWVMEKNGVNSKITNWCGENWGPGIVVVTNIGTLEDSDPNYSVPLYGSNDGRKISCIEQEFSIHSSW